MDNNDYIMVMDELAKTIGAIQGKSSGYLYKLDGLTPEQRLEVSKILMLGAIVDELAALRRGDTD